MPTDEPDDADRPDGDGSARERPGRDEGQDRDTFDAIVERLGLDLTFPDEPPVRRPADDGPADDAVDLDDLSDDRDDQFYRRVEPREPQRLTGPRALGIAAVAGPPVLLALCTLIGFWLPRGVVVACGLIFVAGAVYWIAQLPEHGPGRPDWPDDGAAL